MDRYLFIFFIGIALFSIAATLPIAAPLIENFMNLMKFKSA